MNPRDLVTSRIVEHAKRYPELQLDPLDVAGLESRDAALAKAIDHIIARRWLTLVAILEQKVTQPWEKLEPQVQAPLLVGAAQLLFMERVPDHAIVSEAVAWTKRNARAKAGGLVNAVLRRVAELRGGASKRLNVPTSKGSAAIPRDAVLLDDGRMLQLNEEVFDADPVKRLAQQTSHPEDALQRWKKLFGEKPMTRLALHNLVHPPIVVAGVEHEAPSLIPHEKPGFHVFTGSMDELHALLQQFPEARVQDPATAEAIASMKSTIGNPRCIIDLCAGKGTKTRQLADLFPKAQIIATDIDDERFVILQETFSNQADNRIEVIPFEDIRKFDERADLLVIDAPCSNTGVMARRVEAKYRLTPKNFEKLSKTQRQILADSIPLLAPSGQVLYITCSIEYEENQQQAQWLCKWHRMRVLREHTLMPQGLPGEESTHYHDGAYAALVSKQ